MPSGWSVYAANAISWIVFARVGAPLTENVSPDQVGAQLLTLQTNLQASMEVTGLLSQLSLVNFLPA